MERRNQAWQNNAEEAPLYRVLARYFWHKDARRAKMTNACPRIDLISVKWNGGGQMPN